MLLKQKFFASIIHFSASILIFSALISTLLLFWYPSPYFSASGGLQGIKLVALVDIILGPVLTFIIFNNTKPRKELLLDMGFIILIQISALSWGVYTIHSQRPIAIVFWENSFYTVPYKALEKHYKNDPKYIHLIEKPRQLLYGDKPTDPLEIQKMVKRSQQDDLPPHHQIEFYKPLEKFFNIASQYSINIHEVIMHNQDMKQQLDNFLQQKNQSVDDYIYLALKSRYRNIILIFDRNGKQLGFIQGPFIEENQQ